MKKKMLLHSCCAPCTSGVLHQLEEFDITLLYYNPNIDTLEEYNKRLDALELLVNKVNEEYNYDIKLIAIPYEHTEFSSLIKGMENEKEGGERCKICIAQRIDFTGKYAKEHGYDIFASTLSVSPHKNHELINKIGNITSNKFDIEYYPSNFKKNNGFLISIQNSKKYGLYRQTYCGCNPNL
jgi:predicted adenine nucleotide alpha hydrolase (AANH) superfamily ATPase